MDNIWWYLTQPYAIFSVTAPWLYVVYWYCTEGRRSPPSTTVLWHWMVLVIFTYNLTVWRIDGESISLHMVDAFFIYLAFMLYLGAKFTPGAAYVLSFVNMWAVDMTKAYELVLAGYFPADTYFFGVGGAGYMDGLCIFPFVSAALVHYVGWRRKDKGPGGPLSSRRVA